MEIRCARSASLKCLNLTEVHHAITSNALFTRGDYVAVAASGGKDSTVLAYVMKLLNERYGATDHA